MVKYVQQVGRIGETKNSALYGICPFAFPGQCLTCLKSANVEQGKDRLSSFHFERESSPCISKIKDI